MQTSKEMRSGKSSLLANAWCHVAVALILAAVAYIVAPWASMGRLEAGTFSGNRFLVGVSNER